MVNLISTLQLLQQTTQVLQWLEQLQQQRPGVPPLIARTVSSRTLSSTKPSTGTSAALKPVTAAPIEPFGPRTSPAHVSLPAWQQRLSQRRQSAPAGRLFLDDLVDQLLKLSAGQRAVDYPYSDVLSCVEALFMTGSSSSGAWTAKLALLLYYLLDGGWITSAATFAQVIFFLFFPMFMWFVTPVRGIQVSDIFAILVCCGSKVCASNLSCKPELQVKVCEFLCCIFLYIYCVRRVSLLLLDASQQTQ